MMKSTLSALFILATILLSTGKALAKSDYDFSPIDRYIQQAKKDIGLQSGTAVAIVKDGKIIYDGYFGYANIKEKKVVNAETAFYLASVTKPMFALSTLLKLKEGDIKETTTMSEMFPKMKFPNINADKITVKHLLSHTSALENEPLVVSTAYTGLHDKASLLRMLAETENDESANFNKFNYTNLGYNILSIWMEKQYHQDWQKTMAETVYQPLSMKRTSSYMTDAKLRGFDVARPYALKGVDPTEILAFEKSNSTMHAAGGTISTAPDLARFLIAELNHGFVDGKQVFPADIIKKSQQKLADVDSEYRSFKREGYAWGWYIGPYKGETMYHHFGGIAGTHSHLSFIPEKNIGLVVVNNESHMSSALTDAIADIGYSILLEQGNPKSISKKHNKAMVKEVAKIQQLYKQFYKTMAERTMDLSLNKMAYVGSYHNENMGDLTIELTDKNEFRFTFGSLHAISTAYKKKDTMRLEFLPGMGLVAAFDVEGDNVSGVNLFHFPFKKL